MVDYTIEDLMEHLFKDFLINEYTSNDYRIDHIIPVDRYNFSTFEDEEFKKCWSFRNLRIVTKEENLNKGNKLDKKLIILYNIEDLLPKGVNIEDL